MSGPATDCAEIDHQSPRSTFEEERSSPSAATVRGVVADGVRAGAFRGAVVLPFLTLPLVFGASVGHRTELLVTLLLLNILCLIGGHGYNR